MSVEYAFPTRERAERFAAEQNEKGRFYKVVATDTGWGVMWDEAAAERWRQEWLHTNARGSAVVAAIVVAILGWVGVVVWMALR